MPPAPRQANWLSQTQHFESLHQPHLDMFWLWQQAGQEHRAPCSAAGARSAGSSSTVCSGQSTAPLQAAQMGSASHISTAGVIVPGLPRSAAGRKACIYATHIYVPFMLLLYSPLAWITHSGYLYRQLIYKANGTEAEQLLYEHTVIILWAHMGGRNKDKKNPY